MAFIQQVTSDQVVAILSYISAVITVCSALHLILPAYELFNEFPKFKKYYKLAVLIVGAIALNRRGTVVKAYKDRL